MFKKLKQKKEVAAEHQEIGKESWLQRLCKWGVVMIARSSVCGNVLASKIVLTFASI